MYTNRFIRLPIAISLLAVVVLVVREANATISLVANVDSATRSYIAQAKAVACGVDATYGPDLGSATRSYIAWGLALQAKNDIGALCR